MKRFTALCLALILLMSLTACESYQLDDGRFALEEIEAEEIIVPYLLIREGEFTVVQHVAVSYQPGGNIVKKGNKLVMETKYLNQECKWTFKLIADNKLQFVAGKSELPNDWDNWKDGMVFTLSKK